ncbi:hypothetical protein [[Flexibacter] sp. ATCC 35208]|uniref:hypothetical protein n=1 Tax=[Flexibacter] sp. ATCC 35208 TaxID=1936242 RepID=UPI0009CC7E82|nr:hypothetical protein [[Flexibacter] sp. ATCC 35208]OMP77139.1 hypothetical protein BW716_21415 [[Flexibacter] sp. ATCC 35208]
MKHLFDYIRDGVTQSERYLPALHPSYVKIDDRSPADLLMQLVEFSKQIRYYNLKNEPDGHWQEFLQGDLRVVLQYIARLDFGAYQTVQQDIRQGLEKAGNEEQLREGLTALFDLLYTIAILLGHQLQLARTADTAAAFWNYIDQVMDSVELDVYHLLSYETQALALFQPGTTLHTVDPSGQFARSAQRAAQYPHPGTFLGYESLNEIYNRLRATFYQVTSAANRQLKLLEPEHQHHPHIGLLLAFLELYKQLQQQINGLTARHLEYYYTTVLGIPFKNAEPDVVHVLIVPMPNAPNQVLPENTLFPAELVKGKPHVLFRLLFKIPVSQTRLVALRTVFVGHHKQIRARDDAQQDMVETQLYMKKQTIPTAAAYLPDAPPVQSWPMLGEEQAELGDNNRTMDIMSMGFILASPVLCLEEGARTVTIHLYGTPASFEKLNSYISNLSVLMNRKEDVLKWELLSSAFQIYYTGPEGWLLIKEYTARFTTDGIQISYTIGMTAPPAVAYNPKLHGEKYQIVHPMVKIELNNSSFHHPYSYLQYMKLDRVTIHAKVKGFRSVQLQNNVGPLSAANPFQLFGPAPTVGSYLQITNANIFNRYTKQFTLQLEWLDLPAVEGGFDNWYADYNAGITNDAFQVSLSNMRDGVFLPAKEKRQQFHLFKLGQDKKLSEKTDIRHIDFLRINFNNSPRKSSYYEDGVVRLELTGPPDAFGHRLYTQLFPEVVTHNANKWAKKRRIPNPPYIPIVKSITVEYDLEHTEVFKPELVEDVNRHTALLHIYPFGYRLAYPQANESEFTLLPEVEHAANLYIGLEKVKQQEILSFLFQLEEKYYSDTTGTLQSYQWSYLHNDKWLPLEQQHILADSTQSFIRSGIVVLKMPMLDAGGHTRLEPGIQWLRLSCAEAPATRPMVKGIFLNAGIVRREQADTAISTSLPPLSIKSLQKEVRGIQQVYQLFPSFGGRPAETKEEYYVRVSERLRHKNRPVLGVDIIQMVLEAFPDILIAKYISNHEDTGPDLQLIVVPRLQKGMEMPEPRTDLATLYSIRDYVKSLMPPYMEVAVHNPVYERVKVICDVRFYDNDSNYYLNRMQDDIHHFLTPWLYDKDADLSIGSRIYLTDLISFIRKLPYVTYMTAFSLVHFFTETDPKTGEKTYCALDTALEDVEFIMPSTPGAVLIPANHHLINVISESIYREPSPIGINGMITGEEMIVGKKLLPNYGHTADNNDMEGEMIRLSIHSK